MANSTPAPRPPTAPRLPLSSYFTQMYPPKPAFTEKNVSDQSGKVYIVTGSNTGVGKEVAQILYSKNAKVYVAARSEDKAKRAISDIQTAWPQSKGSLSFLYLDFADLSTIKPAVERFTARESKLHVLFNNAAIQSLKDDGSVKTAQGYEVHFGVNIMGPFLFTKLLTPLLVATAKTEPANTVRVVWVCSLGTEVTGEKSHGISLDYLKYWPSISPLERYGVTKAGNWLHGVEFAKRYKADGVVSVPCNPGHLSSDLYRDGGRMFKAVLSALFLFPPKYGAYTELFSGLSSAITLKETGKWVVPWGRLYPIRKDMPDAAKPEKEGGNGHAKNFWEWSEEQVRDYT
uniref:Putative short-chain dehydrogenase/reductase n=1 Tax=Cladonia uncialis subsp. uncialis TaxID=180999 RepID=A0A1Z1C4H4_CLAUC|nr:putative short-chain dehydrogenase/reductase [Cladonia uncialis subsp. uncialis]AUW31407.1 putative short-chain dehydrogenase/reductase [Cladonia uncialis subsp. uncialis]